MGQPSIVQHPSKTVLVTGSEGFVAQNTIPILEQAGYEVIPYDLKLKPVGHFDVCDTDVLRASMPPGCKVLHLAAVAKFVEADRNPAEAYRTNVGGVATVLRVAAEVGAERVVLASTASVYMPIWCIPTNEHHPISGNSHYGLSKAMGERMVGLHQVPFVLLRYAHLFGPLKWHGGLIDSFIERVKRGASPVLYGGWQSNDFTYIKDVVRANLAALETPYVNEAFNIGTGLEVTTDRAAEILAEELDYTGPILRQSIRIVDAPRFILDVSKATRLLGHTAQWTFKDGLRDMLHQTKNQNPPR